MSRSSKGPRRDLHVLKRLKEASSNPSSLLDGGDAIMAKVDKITGFIQQQKTRTLAAQGKSEWLIIYQHLQDERESCERDLHSSLSDIAESGPPELQGYATDCLASCKSSSEECRMLRTELKLQIAGACQAHSSLRAGVVKAAGGEHVVDLEMVGREIRFLREDVNLQIAYLTEQMEQLSTEIELGMPSDLVPTVHDMSSLVLVHAVKTPVISPEGEEIDFDHNSKGVSEGAASSLELQTKRFGCNASKECAELESVISRYPLSSTNVRMRIREVHSALQERFVERLQTWRLECELSGDSDGAVLATGGWKPEEHSQFVKLRERYFKDGLGTKGGRDAALYKVACLLPGRDLEAVLQHDDWYVAARLQQRRRRDILESWGRERRQFLEDSESFLEESSQVNQAMAVAAANRLAHELVREGVHEELASLRALKQAEWEAGAEERVALEAAELERQRIAHDIMEEDKAKKKEMLAEYRAQLDRKIQEEEESRLAREKNEALLRAEQAGFHKSRVEWRHAEYLWKMDKQQEERAALEKQELERQARLDRLRALVAPHVECDPLRILKPTEASSSHDEDLRELAESAAFRPVYGYTVQQLYKDPKFKLMDALQRQGLHNTAYGRQIISNAQTAKPTRPDNLTYAQRAVASHR
ncbi:hypothetical protein CEUSTIGMA_g9619.t1 [Chlamydomonas eustigma]|uniref:Coiled-coil domain-containing protein 148 n=1 Tax=Chlamydomonas eustigma TaxID=1157962 RepID=A0A250XGI4_9CHLO|nr:hypothetical protein CEUSTIGMA_g9619.t1 [Chlamydomonas eustigma]|eukprot:GAX82191.1 hypothetical protein CEUSTIGMA_g9619.t1 [Chlamydomonas eustigma]